MNSGDDITLLMPTRNSMPYLEDALHSVEAQQLDGLQIVAVDAESTDGTAQSLSANPRVTMLKQSGRGLAQAWNQAMASVQTDLVGFLDSDDVLTPGAMGAHLSALNSGAEVSIGRVAFFLDGEHKPPGVRAALLDGDHFAFMPGCTVMCTEVARSVGPFLENLAVTPDIDWFDRLRSGDVRIARLDEVVLRKRIHDSNLSFNGAQQATYDAEMLQVARAAMLRRRADSSAIRDSSP